MTAPPPGTGEGSPAAATADLRAVALTKRFGDVVAVDAIDLHIAAGSFFALLGPSGCGKTTTLRMIAGLEEPTSGQILLGDTDITQLRPYKRPVNTVFQSYALFPHLDVTENVAFGLRRRKVDGATLKRAVAEMLELVQLGDLARRRPAELSGGQQQRVALARALVNRPQVLLLDEPLGALDLRLRKQMQLELKGIQNEVGVTFVHVTHDQEEAMTMADTIAVMNAGRVEQLGAPADLYDRPTSTFVANFLGQSNLLEGTIEGGDGEHALVAIGDARVRVPIALAPDRGAARIGVRPEKLTIAPAGETAAEDGRNQLGGVVTDRSFIGVSYQYVVRTATGDDLAVVAQNLTTAASVAPGDEVVVRWSPEHTFVVDVP